MNPYRQASPPMLPRRAKASPLKALALLVAAVPLTTGGVAMIDEGNGSIVLLMTLAAALLVVAVGEAINGR